ncbi:MAG: hypothetical protein AAGJ82_08270 [Bacteroidota bacterium]
MSAYVNMDTIRFQLFDVHELKEILHLEHYADHDEESVNIFT